MKDRLSGNCNIQAGEELFYDYGVRNKEIPWLISDGKAMVQTKPKPAAAKNRVSQFGIVHLNNARMMAL